MKEYIYKLFLEAGSVCTDSRNCPKGSLFFALRGDNFDGNRYAKTAIENGCSYAVIDNVQYQENEKYILVEDSLKALQNLALTHRQNLNTKIVGITGTNGKTTTKELLANVLKQKYSIYYTQGNLNNHIGVPLTLLSITNEHQMAVVEMGANHPNEIEELASISMPNSGVVTNVGMAHLQGFGSLKGVMKTKAELYQNISKTCGDIFVNSGNPLLMSMLQEHYSNDIKNVHRYEICNIGECEIAGKIAIATSIKVAPYLSLSCITKEGEMVVNTNLIGKYNSENVLAAVAIGAFYGLSNSQIKKGLEEYIPSNNRSQLIETENNKLIADLYNANPTSMAMAIENFSDISAPNKLLVLGDMLELGEKSDEEHLKIVNLLKEKSFENVILVGKEFCGVNSSFNKFENVEKTLEYITKNRLENRFILIKGSRGVHLERIIAHL